MSTNKALQQKEDAHHKHSTKKIFNELLLSKVQFVLDRIRSNQH